MPTLECYRCGFRAEVPERELKFGLDCLECHARMGPVRPGGPPRPVGGVGGMTFAESRVVFAGPVGIPAGLFLMWFSRYVPCLLDLLVFGLGALVVLVGVVTIPVGVMTLVRHLTRRR